MKTKVRTTEYSQNGYNFMSIEILRKMFAGPFGKPLTLRGNLTIKPNY